MSDDFNMDVPKKKALAERTIWGRFVGFCLCNKNAKVTLSIHLFTCCLLRAYGGPGSVLGTGDLAIKKH